MSYLISNFAFTLTATFILGLLLGWVMWGHLKNKLVALETDWQHRYKNLDNDLCTVVEDFSELEQKLKKKSSRISTLNDERNNLTEQLGVSKAILQKANSEIEQLKSQLGQITAQFHVSTKELDKYKQELSSIRENPNESEHLKSLLGEATKRYNKNSSELKNKQDEITLLKLKFDETKKLVESLNKEVGHLRSKLLKRDKEFENQIQVSSDLKIELNKKKIALQDIQVKLDTYKNSETDAEEIHQRDEIIKNLQLNISELSGLQKSFESREKEISDLEHALQLKQELNSNLNAQIQDATQRIETAETELSDTKKRNQDLESSIRQRDNSIAALETELTKLSNEIPPLRDNLDKRDERITQLKQDVNTLQQKIPAFRSTITARDAHIRELENFIKDAQKAILKPASRSTVLNGNGHGNGIANGNGHANGAHHNNVVHINGNGNSRITRNGNVLLKTNGASQADPLTSSDNLNEKSPNKNVTKQKIKSYGLKVPSRKPDDLKLISGVGVALEKTLHKCGIYYFEQIAGFTRKDVAAVDDMLNFKGRIDRDEWIKQAKILIRGGTYIRKVPNKKNTTRKRRMKALGMKRPTGELDDLQLINGVGPKLERKLHRLGIYHYEQIAGFTAEDIELLDSKLKTYKGRVKRDKWPMQARRLHKEFHLNP